VYRASAFACIALIEQLDKTMQRNKYIKQIALANIASPFLPWANCIAEKSKKMPTAVPASVNPRFPVCHWFIQ
jgi:hypothetical protein